MAEIELEQVSKVYPDGTPAVDSLDLAIGDGEFVVLVGPSGCGKTSALRMVAGLEELTGGTIRIAGHVVNDLLPKERDIAMVFQNYALYPHMTVYDNMAFGLRHRRVPKDEIEQRVTEAAHTLGLEENLHRKPRTLSRPIERRPMVPNPRLPRARQSPRYPLCPMRQRKDLALRHRIGPTPIFLRNAFGPRS